MSCIHRGHGHGAQAVTQLHAISRVFTLDRVLVYDTNPDAMHSFARRTAFLGLDVRPASLVDVETQSDIVCTATSVAVGAGPVISGHAMKPHVHINAVGSDLPGKTELPLSLLRRSLVCPDYPAQARVEGSTQACALDEVPGPVLDLALRSAALIGDGAG